MTQFRPQLAVACKNVSKLKFPLIAEPKLDGVRCVCVIKGYKPTFWSRDGKPFLNFKELETQLESYHLQDMIIDGEIMAVSGNFDDTISRSRSHAGVNNHIDYIYHMFDILMNTEPLGTIYPLQLRKDYLTHLFGKGHTRVRVVPYQVVNSLEHLGLIHMNNCNDGFEGTMVKPLDSIYHQGRNQAWKKIKPFYSADLRITGMSEGKGKAEDMMGRIEVQGYIDDINGELELDINGEPTEKREFVKCEVGTGFSDELRKKMWDNQSNYIGKFIEVQYQEVTKDNSLRFPSFKRFREDKDNG